MQFIDLQRQYQQVKADVLARIEAVLDHGKYIMGPEVAELEQKLADFSGAKHCIGVANGTDALMLALMALGVKAGDEVITTPFSFFATAEVIRILGAEVVLVDIDPKTYNIDPNLIEQAITDKTKAIMPVSLYGQCADYDAINAIADKHNIAVIEDGAQSFGATYKKRQSCNLTTIGCTSFFPSKPLGGYGDAGACFTNDDNIAELLRQLRVHGQSKRYTHTHIGVNSRLDSMQAAIILAKLDLFKDEVLLRKEIGQCYSDMLAGHEQIITPYIESHNTSVYAQYTVQVPDRAAMQDKFKQANIPSAVHYPIPLHQQEALKDNVKLASPMEHVDRISQCVMSIPMHPYLIEDEMVSVVDVLTA